MDFSKIIHDKDTDIHVIKMYTFPSNI